jgi:hypothetical protein
MVFQPWLADAPKTALDLMASYVQLTMHLAGCLLADH